MAPPASVKPRVKGKQRAIQPAENTDEKRRAAMTAANAAAQSLGIVVQSGWKALNPDAAPGSLKDTLSVISSFKLAVSSLRELMPRVVDVERVVSSFVGKLIAVQLYEVALELLHELRVNINQLYHESPCESVLKKGSSGQRISKSLSIARHLPLLQYPLPPPTDVILLSIIGTSIAQALAALAVLVSRPPMNDAILDTFVSAIEGDNGILMWRPFLPEEHADTLLARVHRALAMTFSSSNTSPAALLRLRAWALQCLLSKTTLDSDSFWTQATNYIASHGKNVIKAEDGVRAISDVVKVFNVLVAMAQGRCDASTFLSGSSFVKFCEVTLVFAQRGDDMSNLRRIVRFIKSGSDRAPEASLKCEFSTVQLYATFSQGATMLERFLDLGLEEDLVDILTQCTEALNSPTALFSGSDTKSNTLRSLEKLRRLCGKVLEEEKCGKELRNAIKLVLECVIENIEIAGCRLTVNAMADLGACAVDSLCTLSKISLSPANPETYQTAHEYLQHGVNMINAHETSMASSMADLDAADALAKLMRCISGAFWNHAITLYQGNRCAAAVRFLVQACHLGARACEKARDVISTDSAVGTTSDAWTVLKAHLPKRWELLGECYFKIGDRKLAYEALIESIKAYSFESLCLLAASSSPSQISLNPGHSRLSSLVERITHVAVYDLFITDKASLRTSLCDSQTAPEAVGLLLEWQAAGLEENLWKSESRPIIALLLRDALDLYGVQFPIRRARVLLRQLEIAYRIDDLSFPATDVMAEIQALLSKPQETGKDATLSGFCTQYQATAHMWMAFHAHRQSVRDGKSAKMVLQQATSASKILRGLFPATPLSPSTKSPKLSPKLSGPQQQVATRTSPRKKAAIARTNPVTPKPKPRKKAMQTPPKLALQGLSPKSTPVKRHASAVDSHLTKTVEMLAQLLGLLGHVPLRIQLLSILQSMAKHSPEPSANEFVRASVEAAAEYLSLGKAQRALAIYGHALAAINDVTPATISQEIRISLLLRYAEALALGGNISKSTQLYEEARNLAESIEYSQPKSTVGRIRARVQALERSALASRVFSLIQVAKDDPHAALSSLRQSLRLWNRAFDSLARLSPTQDRVETNPFDMSSLAAALPHPETGHSQKGNSQHQRNYRHSTVADSLEWRIAEGLLHTLFDLARAYFEQGSVRGAEYFIEQARDLADSLNSPTMVGRALGRRGELQLHQGSIQEATRTIMEAADLLHDLPGVDAADIIRLRARLGQLLDQNNEANNLYLEAMSIVYELEKTLSTIDCALPVPRRSFTQSPGKSSERDVIAPDFLAMVLKHHIWLQRNEPRNITRRLLDMFSALPPSRRAKSEELAIMAKLALHDAHVQFHADLFLSSLTESTIAIPMGLSGHDVKNLSVGAKQMLDTLSAAETMFWAHLDCVSDRGQALDARAAAISLALIRSFQTSLGKGSNNDARVAVRLLDASAAITLRRELIDAIDQKFPELAADDLIWRSSGKLHIPIQRQNIDMDDDNHLTTNLRGYWNSVRTRHCMDHGLEKSVSTSQVDLLPANWTVVNISISEDKNTMFLSRQRPHSEPLLFCVPLERHGRKEEDAEEQFVFDDAMRQFGEILRESDQSAKDAKDVPSEDRDAKAAWWAKRVLLDKRMRDLLENIEFCWLGAFKTILHEPVKTPPDILSSLRARFDKIFHRTLPSDKKRASRLKLDDTLMECFASLSPKCRDEELEDLVYFVLDLYQFHGLHVALSEIDIDQVSAELRTALEEYTAKGRGRVKPMKDAHLFLVLDKNVQGIPWESIPILRGKSVSRIPSLSFLVDRIEFAKVRRTTMGLPIVDGLPLDRAVVNPKKTYYVLNPSGDLTKSEGRFAAWVKDMGDTSVGWQGIVGRVPSEQELLEAFLNNDLVIYIGHGGAEQYVRSNKIKHLSRCAATMLWGCSSGLMRDMGDFDRTGTPYNYMMAGCPTLVACLWDVTDNELDKFSRSVFEKLRFDVETVKSWNQQSTDDASVSLVTAVAQSRDVCKLKYLTGAAPVVYGIPFYL